MEIDPIILELRADTAKFRADILRATRTVDQEFGRQRSSTRQLERQMLRSSTAISGSLRGLAGPDAKNSIIRLLRSHADVLENTNV